MSKKKNIININTNSKDNPKELSIALKEEGNKFFMDEKYDKALELYSNSILLDNTNPIFFSNRSACFLAIGDYDSSYIDAKKCIEIDAGFTKGYFRAALSLFYKNEFNLAIEIIDKYSKNEESKEEKELLSLREMILAKIQEHDYNQQTYPSYSKFNTFLNWLDKGLVYYPKLEVKFFSDDHRGIYAKTRIQKDELLMKIPLNMLITLEMAKECSIGMKMLNANLDLLSPKHCFLSTFLLHEKSKELDSLWQLYLDILPKSYENFPIFFTEEEKKWLEGSPFLSQIADKITDIEKDYKLILAVAPEFEEYSFKEFSEMRMAVSSRIFGIRVNGRKTDCFAPLADMLNHRRPRHTQWFYSDDLKAFVIQATHDINKASQVFDSYGKKCNSRFLLNYGFIVTNNEDNEYPFNIELTPKHPLYSYKINLIVQTKDTKKVFKVQADFTGQVVTDFLSYLRFVCFDEDINTLINLMILKKNSEFESSSSSTTTTNNNNNGGSKSSFNTIPPISVKNEIKVLSEIQRITIENLNSYPSDYESDCKLTLQVENGDVSLTSNQRNCLMMRKGEKKILLFFQSFAVYATALFELSSKEIKKKVKKDFPNYCPYDTYINDVVLNLIRLGSSNK